MMAGELRVTRLSAEPDALGESPLWDVRSDCLWWIDGVACKIRRKHWRDGQWLTTESFDLGEHIGSIALAAQGGLVVALERSIAHWDPSVSPDAVALIEANQDARVRLNDGKSDRQGRFVCAGMGRLADPLGSLLQLDERCRLTVLATGLNVGNGVCFSPEGTRLYFSDTPARRMFCCDYDPLSGVASPPREFLNTESFGSGVDGATVDSQGRVWCALIRAAQIACFDPSGALLHSFAAPVDLPSSLAFGGPELRTLFVTSIRDSGTGRTVSTHPLGGHLFAIDGLDAVGIAETACPVCTQ